MLNDGILILCLVNFALIDSGKDVQVVDVRKSAAFARGHVQGAINLPFEHEQGLNYLYHLNKHQPVVVYSCAIYCTLAEQAAYLLARNGYNVKTMLSGWDGWMYYNLPVEPVEDQRLHPYQMVDGTGRNASAQ